jgi:hypothetical protein
MSPSRMTLLEEVLPSYDFSEHHERVVAAPSTESFRAATSVTLGQMPLSRVLFRVRSGAAPLLGKQGLPNSTSEPLIAQMLAFGFVHLAEDPGIETVFGAIGQFWKLTGSLVPVRTASEFANFDRPGFVKGAVNLRALDHPRGSLIETETRTLATDAGSRRAFAFYWMLIRPGSGAIRSEWLRAAARVAEGG